MSKNRNQLNGDISPESAQKIIKWLTHELSNTKREKQLSEQMRSQLEKIHVVTTDINDITYKPGLAKLGGGVTVYPPRTEKLALTPLESSRRAKRGGLYFGFFRVFSGFLGYI